MGSLRGPKQCSQSEGGRNWGPPPPCTGRWTVGGTSWEWVQSWVGRLEVSAKDGWLEWVRKGCAS